jgi:hypothetical protein
MEARRQVRIIRVRPSRSVATTIEAQILHLPSIDQKRTTASADAIHETWYCRHREPRQHTQISRKDRTITYPHISGFRTFQSVAMPSRAAQRLYVPSPALLTLVSGDTVHSKNSNASEREESTTHIVPNKQLRTHAHISRSKNNPGTTMPARERPAKR